MLAFSNDYYGMIFRATQSVELFCAYELNEKLLATILMVTHDAFTASYCQRILFIKDGKIFNEIHKGQKTRKEFFEEIIDVVSLLGGGKNDIN